MISSLRGAVAAMILVAGLGAWSAIRRDVDFQRAKATVSYIDRTCDFVEKSQRGSTESVRDYTESCYSTDEFDTVREKRNKVVSGRAVVHLSYTAPKDGSYQTAELPLTGRDDEFYELKAGDEIDILVSNRDPAKIRKA
jgi:hypothetical protein